MMQVQVLSKGKKIWTNSNSCYLTDTFGVTMYSSSQEETEDTFHYRGRQRNASEEIEGN